jgi:hypothetical protein
MSRATHLKIKLKTLAAEARIIRLEECKARDAGRKGLRSDRDDYDRHYRAFQDLRDHRTGIVRSVARINNLAYGFLRGRSYAEMEPKTRTAVNFEEVLKLVKRFGTPEDLRRWPEWQKAAVAHLDAQGEAPAPTLPSEAALRLCEAA